MTAVLMTLLLIVVTSGLFGAALEHYMPRVMTREVTMETIYEEIGHVRAQLLEEAEELVAKAAAVPEKSVAARAADSAPIAEVAVMDEAAPLRNFFDRELKPFLDKPDARGSALGDAAQARSDFVQLRTLVPPARNSQQSSDVLLPGIATCRSSHHSGAEAAESRCFECHTYHDPAQRTPKHATFSVKDLIGISKPGHATQ